MAVRLGRVVLDTPDPRRLAPFWERHVDRIPDDQDAEVQRALELGATRVHIGQGEVSHVVMANPEGNEFCILRADG
jgi:hypothetical protein